jgi:magnesium-transporting ATPase (P-type)
MTGAEFAAAVGKVKERRTNGEEGEEDIIEYELENQDTFASIIHDLKVIGRADPETKRRLIAGLKGLNRDEEDTSKHRRVAVIGEGINDVKAFRTADVSFALQSGTSIARNNASMILRTDDFDSAMRAVMWGRNIFMNIQRFLQFQITCNISVIIVVMVSYCVRQETVLNPVQLIYINLIMDILGALALSSTKPTEDIKTYAAGEGNIMTPFMYRQIFGGMLGMVGIMMVIMCANKKIFDLTYDNHESTIENKDKMAAFTLMFNTFIFLQIFNLVNCRDVSAKGKNGFAGLHKNLLTVIILAILVAVQFAACFTFLGIPVFETSVRGEKNLEGGRHFAITVVSASSILLINAMLKLIPSKWIAKMPQLDESKAIG